MSRARPWSRGIAFTLAIASLAIVSATVVSTPPARAAVVSSSGLRTVSCTQGNFRGEAQIRPTFTGTNSWSGSGNTWHARVESYRITRLNGQSGGNKANADVATHQVSNGTPKYSALKYSPDNLRQDGQWHSLSSQSYTLPIVMLDTSYLEASVRFVFDKSGSDPQCTARVGLPAGGLVDGIVAQRHAVGYTDPIAYCKVDTPGQRCTITKTDTKSSTVEVSAGVSVGWVTGRLTHSWTNSASVSVGCWSQELEAGQSFYAYPTGTRYTFRTATTFFGEALNPTSGTAFEVDGGVACSVITPEQGRALS
ncbi:hypothetical protein KXS11_00790 [Plantibacter flavus]|uniref:hypothetical protein n=1 Tax=Plantibacter flavus TaxID=150123 RepID=UPI003F13C362